MGAWCFSAVLITACGDRESNEQDLIADVAKVAESTVEVVTEALEEAVESELISDLAEEATEALAALAPAVAPADRAAKLGFAALLPAGCDAYMTIHHGADAVEYVKNLKLWGAIAPAGGMLPFGGFGMPPDFDMVEEFEMEIEIEQGDEDAEPGTAEELEQEPMSPGDLFGTEVTVAFGAGAGGRMAAWLDFNRRSSYFQMRRMSEALMNGPDEDEESFLPGWVGILMSASGPEMYNDLLVDAEAGAAMDRFAMPAIYFAVKVAEDRREQAQEMLAEPVRFLANLGEMVEPLEIERDGATFSGYRLMGSEAAKMLADNREEMDENIGLGDAALDRLGEFLEKQEIVAVSGIMGDYAVIFIGASADEFQFAESPDASFGASEALAFTDAHLNRPLLAVTHGDKDMLKALSDSMGGLAEYAEGLRDGIAANDSTGRDRDLTTLLQLVAERERALQALATQETGGMIVFVEDGLRIEGHGGSSGMLDYQTPARLAALEDAENVAVFFNWSVDSRHSERSNAYYEALIETVYAIALRVSQAPEDLGADDELDFGFDLMGMLRGYSGTFESEFRADTVGLWRALGTGMHQALGREKAMVLDLKGKMPAFPGMPREIVENAGFPRISMISPVTDREQLAASWEQLQLSGANLAQKIGQMMEQEWNMPRPIRSEQDGFTSWFMSMPFFDDEFLPSVTLDDEWFAMGTSRNQSIGLLEGLEDLEARPGGGMRAKVDFRMIADFLKAQFAILEEHRETIPDMDEDEFEEIRSQWNSMVAGLEEFEDLRLRRWNEDGLTRTSLHLKTRN